MAQKTAILFETEGQSAPGPLMTWVDGEQLDVVVVRSAANLMTLALRGRPILVSIDARFDLHLALEACRRMKSDAYTAIVPVVVFT